MFLMSFFFSWARKENKESIIIKLQKQDFTRKYKIKFILDMLLIS